ncbi:hypothetical protein [Amycolatopsis sp. FDAARGOS 1241]|uniref:hypothetical protein n=1 Tax=Amycolatopsis sp. FDAARGOS 1241 TaxID=2778070 RepID=UPI00194F1A13|nr:hypothetical protein [Amycolatopsis sp. FDAARGOS 1241]QRP42731.1 hypothetical protein I6J71_24920 [Amycolatopsis sp. FDAARGOS 1241]
MTDRLWPLALTWFLAAVLAHDLVLFPVYALLDISSASVLRALRGHRRSCAPPRVPVLNYIRIPVLGTALTFLLFLPGIIEQGAIAYQAATGQTQEPYLARWLLVVAAIFAVSAVAYAIRLYVSGITVPAVPATVRAMFEKGEHVLLVADGPSAPVAVVATSAALYRPAGDRPGAWLRTPWHDLAGLESRAEGVVIRFAPAAGARSRSQIVSLTSPAELIAVAKKLVAEGAGSSS